MANHEHEDDISSLNSPRIHHEVGYTEILIQFDSPESGSIEPPACCKEEDEMATVAAGEANSDSSTTDTEMEELHDQQKMTDESFVIAVQLSYPFFGSWHNNANHPLSRNAKILWYFAMGSMLIAYFSALVSILMRRFSSRNPPLILSTIAYAGAVFGFISSMWMLLSPGELDSFFVLLACAVTFPALAAGYIK